MRTFTRIACALVVIAAGCSSAGSKPAAVPTAPAPAGKTTAAVPTALAPATGTLAVVRAGDEIRGIVPGEPPLWTLAHGVAALDGSAVAAASMTAGEMSVAVFDTRNGSRLGPWTFAADAKVRVVSPGGHWLALTREVGEQTEIIVLDTRLGTTMPLRFDGRLEPEAFTMDGGFIVALAYRPDGRYRVQTIAIASGERWDTNDRWKLAEQEDMAGIPVRAVMNGDLLSTLYRDPTSTNHPAFVHTLNLKSGWSHCADLPAPFGTGAAGTDALINSADGKQLFVSSGGSYATINVDAVRHPARDEQDVVAISISTTSPIDLTAFSAHGAAWTTTGLVSIRGATVAAGSKSTIVGAEAQLIAARG